MKFCKDCKWFRSAWMVFWWSDEWGVCRHPDEIQDSAFLVDGKSGIMCRTARAIGKCGENGQLWESR